MFQCGLQIHFDSIRVNPIPQVSAIIIFYPYRCINSCVYILKFRLFTSFIRILVVAHERKTRCGSTFFAVLGAFFLREIPTKFPFLFSTIASYPFTRSHEPPGSFFLSLSLSLFLFLLLLFLLLFFHHDRLSPSRNCATTEIGSHHLDGEILFRTVSTILCNWKIC